MAEQAAEANAFQAASEGPREVTDLEPVGRRRLPSEAQLQPDPSLLEKGWERRFIADGLRAQEAVELYTQLGYEVRAEPVQLEDLPEACEACRLATLLQFKTIYTRRRGPEGVETEDVARELEP
ncbi:MAG TPA: hypothetical protein VJK02_06295 [Anaerolineales bacterium]|nr:hypothetical protein [Anaerolineales bacterium]